MRCKMLLVCLLFVLPMTAWAAETGPIALSDEELSAISAGDIDVEILSSGEVVQLVQGNEAHSFELAIADSAFDMATGIFTTLQTVNSVVDLDVIVNIYVNGGP